MPLTDCFEGGLHLVTGIHYRGKADSIDLECSCGLRETWAEWYGTSLPGWHLTPKMVEAFVSFLRAYHEFPRRTYP